jgi:DNA-binding MarR family transcriptional regulator
MSMDDVYARPGHLFRRMQQIAVAIFMQECEAFDLTPVQYAALVAVREHPGIDATRLAALIAFDRSTIGSVIERLEAKGYIGRSANKDDRRAKLLRLTPSGRSLLRDVMPAVDRAQNRMLERLPRAERKQLVQMLKALIGEDGVPPRTPKSARETVPA